MPIINKQIATNECIHVKHTANFKEDPYRNISIIQLSLGENLNKLQKINLSQHRILEAVHETTTASSTRKIFFVIFFDDDFQAVKGVSFEKI